MTDKICVPWWKSIAINCLFLIYQFLGHDIWSRKYGFSDGLSHTRLWARHNSAPQAPKGSLGPHSGAQRSELRGSPLREPPEWNYHSILHYKSYKYLLTYLPPSEKKYWLSSIFSYPLYILPLLIYRSLGPPLTWPSERHSLDHNSGDALFAGPTFEEKTDRHIVFVIT